jgi:hypothetical protein
MLQLHYTNNVVRLAVNYRCIIVGCRKQLLGVVYYLVLLVLREVTVGHIACGRLHVTKYVFPDGTDSSISDMLSSMLLQLTSTETFCLYENPPGWYCQTK